MDEAWDGNRGRLVRLWSGSSSTRSSSPSTVRRPARVARLLAFAHQLRRGLADGTWASPAAAAKAHRVTRARVSQLLRLTRLAPDVQLAVLSREAVGGREPPVAERWLRIEVARHDDGDAQRAAAAAAHLVPASRSR